MKRQDFLFGQILAQRVVLLNLLTVVDKINGEPVSGVILEMSEEAIKRGISGESNPRVKMGAYDALSRIREMLA